MDLEEAKPTTSLDNWQWELDGSKIDWKSKDNTERPEGKCA